MGMIDQGLVDLLFGNEDEVRHLTGCGELQECLDALSPKVPSLVVTRGARGAVALSDGQRVDIAAAPVDKVVDTTGAGDLFAAGFIAARCRGRDLRGSLEAGSIAAAEVISHFGARPEADLRELVGL
jgi:sugar/nucleoside kinase (ribokinase family)